MKWHSQALHGQASGTEPHSELVLSSLPAVVFVIHFMNAMHY